jgi:hypothetical protein
MTINHPPPGGQQPGRRIPVAGGTASAVIDLAGGTPGRGGHDPGVPQIMTTLQVRGRLVVGHTRSLSDPDEPILIDPCATIYPGGGTADLRCGQCVAKVDVGQLDGATLAVLGHEPGCRWLAGMLEQAGRAS